MSKVKVLIVEDEAIIADDIFDSLEELGYEPIGPANTFSEAIGYIESHHPDVAVLDIQLSGRKSGIDLAETINTDYNFPFIFLSSNTDKITLEQAKNVEPLAYLVKPFSKDELYTSIEVALYNFSKRKESALDKNNLIIQDALFIKQAKLFLRLNFDEIAYLKSDHIYIDIVMLDGNTYSVRGSLNDYINKLSDTFFRAHRSYIINLKHLQALNHNVAMLLDEEIPIGKKQREEILSKLNKG